MYLNNGSRKHLLTYNGIDLKNKDNNIESEALDYIFEYIPTYLDGKKIEYNLKFGHLNVNT